MIFYVKSYLNVNCNVIIIGNSKFITIASHNIGLNNLLYTTIIICVLLYLRTKRSLYKYIPCSSSYWHIRKEYYRTIQLRTNTVIFWVNLVSQQIYKPTRICSKLSHSDSAITKSLSCIDHVFLKCANLNIDEKLFYFTWWCFGLLFDSYLKTYYQ